MAATQIKDGYNGGSDNQLKVNSDGSINVTSGSSISGVATQVDYNTATITYIGKAAPGSALSASAWSIMQMTTDATTGNISILWANGNSNATNIWNNRTSLSYS